jgi:hypothetical protein
MFQFLIEDPDVTGFFVSDNIPKYSQGTKRSRRIAQILKTRPDSDVEEIVIPVPY